MKIVHVSGLEKAPLLKSMGTKFTFKAKNTASVETEVTQVVTNVNPLETEELNVVVGSSQYSDFFGEDGLNLLVEDNAVEIIIYHNCELCEKLYSSSVASRVDIA